MTLREHIAKLKTDEDGGILVFWSVALVVFLGLLALTFDFGRMASTHSELQSFADNVSLAAAAELDGRSDAITRARSAANTLISDSQTYATGNKTLVAEDIATLTFYRSDADGGFTRSEALKSTDPHLVRYVDVQISDHTVQPGLGAAFAALSGGPSFDDTVSTSAAAGFSLEACNVAPIAVCLPTVDFDASTSIGQTLELDLSVNLGTLLPGQVAVVNTLTDALDGLSICAGLLGGDLNACLLAAREPETACTGRGGLEISANVDASELMGALNSRFGEVSGLLGGLLGGSDFSEAPNVLTGLTTPLGMCLPLPSILSADEQSLPSDDCLVSGGCAIQGDGSWTLGRNAYIEAHYDGTDPFPEASTRFEFYQAEIAASVSGSMPGGLLGGLLGGFIPQLCAPQDNLDPTRRVMVVAGIDCLSAEVDAAVTVPPVSQFFEVFALGPAEDGLLNVEISACLGGNCGDGVTGTDVRDVVRLVD
ncbi:hypothetical protein IV417_08995 [Alphaproteobacteria bacterium KMM 3653]|uniref:Putative Flp pilus-assembly TadG-like N-terminal domain-containing protein n=1 Tax=Harenicola maris TaxID=2841044 RepID=A0AAP2G841_9RHOB|nr:hypothetical protein [Harenicola maris]